MEAFGADALTVNGYLGSDGINPLLDQSRKYDNGIFVLVKHKENIKRLLKGEEKKITAKK